MKNKIVLAFLLISLMGIESSSSSLDDWKGIHSDTESSHEDNNMAKLEKECMTGRMRRRKNDRCFYEPKKGSGERREEKKKTLDVQAAREKKLKKRQ